MKRIALLLSTIFLLIGCSNLSSIQGNDPSPASSNNTVTPMNSITTVEPHNPLTATPIITTTPLYEDKTTAFPIPEFQSISDYISFLETVPCHKACFWGIEPGVSTRIDVMRIIDGFEGISDSAFSSTTTDDSISVKITFSNEGFHIGVSINFTINVVSEMSVTISTSNDPTKDLRTQSVELKQISDMYWDWVSMFSPGELWNMFGYPDKILVRTFVPAPEPQNWPTQTFFFYPDDGLIAVYINPTYYIDSASSNYFCLVDIPTIKLIIYDDEIVRPGNNHGIPLNLEYTYPIKDISSTSIEELFNLYHFDDDVSCKERFIVIPEPDEQSSYIWAPIYIQP